MQNWLNTQGQGTTRHRGMQKSLVHLSVLLGRLAGVYGQSIGQNSVQGTPLNCGNPTVYCEIDLPQSP